MYKSKTPVANDTIISSCSLFRFARPSSSADYSSMDSCMPTVLCRLATRCRLATCCNMAIGCRFSAVGDSSLPDDDNSSALSIIDTIRGLCWNNHPSTFHLNLRHFCHWHFSDRLTTPSRRIRHPSKRL